MRLGQKYSTDPDRLLRDIIRTGVVCFDLETSGLDPHTGHIGIVILESGDNLYILRDLPSWFGDVLADPSTRKIGFNLNKFDYPWIMCHYPWRKIRNSTDLYINELMISTQRRTVKHTLQAVLKRRLGVDIDKGIDEEQRKEELEYLYMGIREPVKGDKADAARYIAQRKEARKLVDTPFAVKVDWRGPLSEEMEDYALSDIIYLRDLDQYLHHQIIGTKQERAAKIENDIAQAIAEMSLSGIGIDRPKWEQSIRTWVSQADKASILLDETMPEQPNWNSPTQVKNALRDLYGIELPNTKHATLETFQEEMPALKHLLEYRMWEKRSTGWGHDFLEKSVNPVTGRIHPSWWQLGTDTGRFSCTNPNMQQIPHDKPTRALFKAKEGYLIASIDYKAIEMLVAAVIAKDREFLRVCQEEDPHTQVAQLVLGAGARVTSDERQLAKAVGFGLLFGGGVDGFVEYAKNNYRVIVPRERAVTIVREFFDRFQGLKAMRSKAYSFFRDYNDNPRVPGALEVRTLAGSRRILEGKSCKPTTWLNTQIQGSAGYGIKCSMRRLAEAGLSQYLCLQVHDELVFEFPKEHAEEYAERATACMVKGMQEILGPVKVGVDMELGERWQ